MLYGRTRKLAIQYVKVVCNSIYQDRMPVLATRRCTGKRGALLNDIVYMTLTMSGKCFNLRTHHGNLVARACLIVASACLREPRCQGLPQGTSWPGSALGNIVARACLMRFGIQCGATLRAVYQQRIHPIEKERLLVVRRIEYIALHQDREYMSALCMVNVILCM